MMEAKKKSNNELIKRALDIFRGGSAVVEPEAAAIEQRLSGSHFERDAVVARAQREIQQLLRNAHCIKTGLAQYAQLTWRNLLGRNGLIDRNAARNLTGRLRGFFPKGTVPAIEQQIHVIHSRLAYLMQYSSDDMPPAQAEAVIIPPEPTPTQPAVIFEPQDPRVR